jgi:hypothetical protein
LFKEIKKKFIKEPILKIYQLRLLIRVKIDILDFRPLKSDSASVRSDSYKPSLEVQIQSQRKDIAQRAIQPSGSGYEYYGRW